MLYSLARNWWWFALRGGLAILLGIAALVWPELTMTVLVLLFGAYALAFGVVLLGLAFRLREFASRGTPSAAA